MRAQLKEFDSFKAMLEAAGQEQVLEWVNTLAREREARNLYHKTYQRKRAIALKEIKKMLAPDELARMQHAAREAALGTED